MITFETLQREIGTLYQNTENIHASGRLKEKFSRLLYPEKSFERVFFYGI